MNKTEIRQVIVEGTAPTKENAVSLALSNIQKKIAEKDETMIIRIEPLQVEVIEATCDEWTEKFLFFFSPQKRTKYSVKLSVQVQVTTLEVSEIQFEKRK